MLRLLGPVELAGAASSAAVSPRQLVVLAVLAVDAGRAVPVDVLIDRVWAAEPPTQARRTLQAYVARARRVLAELPDGPVRIDGGGGTYSLRIRRERVDLHVFRSLVVEAREPACPPDRRVEVLREAATLWRGQPLAGLAGAWPDRMRQSWRLERAAATVSWADAELAAGDPAVVLGPLTELAAEFPFDEALAGALMRVLARLGRADDALLLYEQTRGRLAEELGIDPGQQLLDAHREVAPAQQGTDRSGPPSPGVSSRAHLPGTAPAQLPPGLAVFAGRAGELAGLDALAAGVDDVAAPRVVEVTGTAGVGKTTLAITWAHRVAHRFPDGQLYVNLRGFDPTGTPVDPSDALRRFLDALAVPAEHVPAEVEAQAALFRSSLAGKRLLVVLDNARDADHIRLLLPGSAGCLTLVTSRKQVTGRATASAAHPIHLDLLTLDEARQLLTGRLGRRRVATEPAAVDTIIARCARLPLALAVAAARAATHPTFPLATIAAELTDRLDSLQGGDPATDLRAVLACSYRTLTGDAARLFRLLGLHPGPDLSVNAAASLAGQPPHRIQPLLAELTGAHLIAEHPPGRYTFHDLLHAYATEQALATDHLDARRTAVHRLLDHYLHTAQAAAKLLQPERPFPLIPAALPNVTTDPLHGHDDALSWFGAERLPLLEAVRVASAKGFDVHAMRQASLIGVYLVRQGLWHEQVAMQRHALDTARRLDDPAEQALSLRGLAATEVRLGRLDEAEAHYKEVLDLHEQLDDPTGHGHAYIGYYRVAEERGDFARALERATQAYDRYRAGGFRPGQASALNAIGWTYAQLGEHQHAIDICRRALTQLQDLGYREAEAATWDSLGHAYQGLDDLRQAVDCNHRARDIYHEIGSRYDEAVSLDQIGDLRRAMGDHDRAGEAWRAALGILNELNHPHADQVRAKLAGA